MIRPIICLALLAACGSGLYVYQEKHRVQVLDRQIEQTVHETDKLREQTRMLHAEWTLLNDPERLRQLANQFLTLQTVSPTQYTSMADLDARLPPVQVPAPPAAQPDAPATTDVPVAQAEPAPPVKAAEPAAAPRQVAVAPPPRAPDAHPVPPRPVIALARPADTHIRDARFDPRAADRRTREADARRAEIAPQPRPLMPRRFAAAAESPPRFVRTAPPPQPYSGSLLGMAHGQPNLPAPVPLPRPVPVNVYQMMGGGNGG